MEDRAIAAFEPMRRDGFTYDILKGEDVPGAAGCLGAAFLNEPMTRVLGIMGDELGLFTAPVVEKACEEGLSVVARDGESAVAGALVCLDWTSDIPVAEGVARKCSGHAIPREPRLYRRRGGG